MTSAPILPPLQNLPGYRRVAELIETEILEGRISPGDLLPTEAELASQLGVNRSTVREGIRALENADLLRRVGAKRLMVTIPTARSVAQATARAIGMRRVSFRDLWEVQMQLEPFVARLAAERAGEEHKAALSANVEQMTNLIDSDRDIIFLDIEFHRLVAQATGNVPLMLSQEPINTLLYSATLKLYERVPAARHRLLDSHRTISSAILTGDAETAELWAAKHIQDFRRGYEIAGVDLDAPIRFHPNMALPPEG